MAGYKPGEETKRIIMKSARELFYKQGYLNTTYMQLSEKANVNTGTIVYHFSTIENLAYLIFLQITEDHGRVAREKIDAAYPDNNFHEGLKSLVEYRVNTDSYITYPNYVRFLGEILYKSFSLHTERFERSAVNISNYFDITLTKEEIILHKYLFLPFANQVTNAINNGIYDMTSKQICDYHMRARLRTIGAAESEIDRTLYLVDEISSNVELKIDEYMEIS